MSEIECAMNSDLPTWDSNRWRNTRISRNESHANGPTSPRIQDSPQHPGPQPSGLNPTNPMSQKATHETFVLDSWIGKSRGMGSRVCDLPRLTEPYAAATEASTYLFHPQQRHSLNYGPQQLANDSPRETSAGTWRSLQHEDRRESTNHTADAPLLTLQIPQPLDLHRPSTLNTPSLSNGRPHSNNDRRPAASTATASTLLPSFAALQEHTDRVENGAETKVASMLPLYRSQERSTAPSFLSRNFSPPNLLKRLGEPLDRGEIQSSKRPHSGASGDQAYQLGRQGSIDYSARAPRRNPSPPPADSVPGSAHPRLSSPNFERCGSQRTLPSPSSRAYPASAAPSVAYNTAQSGSSPATSYQPPSTIHTASSTSATSQHIADLQHQVTLQSLALQTLQSEYASLLQKLQRERVKSQTIEKKTSAADQEVNDLTGKNEDLTEQVKTLEAQLEESERKREDQRQEAAREKEQWGRMLEMSGRLQNRADAEKQRLLEEKNYLTQRLARHDETGTQRPDEQPKQDFPQAERLRFDSHGSGSEQHPDMANAKKYMPSNGISNQHDQHSLEQEVVSLRTRVHALRTTLEGVRRHNEELEVTTRGFLEQTGLLWSNVSRALDDDNSHESRAMSVSRTKIVNTNETWTQKPPENSQQPGLPQSPASTRQPGTLEIIKDGKISLANIAEVSRAKSAEPQELGFHVPTTTSSPEELIKALGPVPTPLPPIRYPPPTTSWTPITPSSQNDKPTEPVSAFAPSFPPGYIGHHRPALSSPRSHHSSNADGNGDETSSSPGTGRRSPDTYNSEPEPSTTRPTTSQSVLTLARPALSHFHSHSFHGHTRSAEWMPPPPPPPKSELTYMTQTGTHA
ncbi:hypothetical protein CLAFUR4_02176 [Fulvia fulva]|nr:hypothetical protein CLAFUR4_02176 [Fulvia fulva]